MTESTRILLLVPGFPAHEADSTCLPAVQSFVEALARKVPANAVDIIAFQYPYERRTYTWRGIRVHALAGNNSAAAKPLTWARALRRATRLVTEHGADVIHSLWLGECAFIGKMVALHHRRPHVVSIGGQEARSPTVYTRILRRTSFFLTAPSHTAAECAREALGRPPDELVPLGLDVDRFRSIDADIHRDIDILAVGSLIPLKRLIDAVDVTANLAERGLDVSTVLVGDGPERAAIRARIEARGLNRRITLAGALPRPDVLRLMRRSKVLFHPSEYESQGYVFLEALASGMYVVSRRVGYAPGSPKMIQCSMTGEMEKTVASVLGSTRNHMPEKVWSAEASVLQFLECYRRAAQNVSGGYQR